MYSREYAGQELRFEASGGLTNSSLVMQDKETDTYWSIMQGRAIGGELDGTDLLEMPYGEKLQWSEWKSRHPGSLVLSVRGREWLPDAYAGYWASPDGFRGQSAEDDRLETKTPIYAFEHSGRKYAVPHEGLAGGRVFEMPDGMHVLLFRSPGSEMFASTFAYISPEGFSRSADSWQAAGSGALMDSSTGAFAEGVEVLTGFDTFWYNWSLNNPDTELLR